MAKKPRKHQALTTSKAGAAGKSAKDQTRQPFEHDPKGRTGQYTATGSSALTKK